MIIHKVNRMAENPASAEPIDSNIHYPQVEVPRPDLSKFDQYLTLNQGEVSYV
jgi:hypothetical protein